MHLRPINTDHIARMVREVPSVAARAYMLPTDPRGVDPYVSRHRKRNLWRTSPSRRTQNEADGHRDVTAAPICGRCIARAKTTGRRCGRMSCLDYRYCTQHLAAVAHLAIAPSRRLRDLGVPDKALGLYAVAGGDDKLRKDRRGFPLPPSDQTPRAVVFQRGRQVALYGGEMLQHEDMIERYQDPRNLETAAYARGMAPRAAYDANRRRLLDAEGRALTHRPVIDGLAAASAATYSNEAMDVGRMLRRARTPEDFAAAYAAAVAADMAKNGAHLINVESKQRQNAVYLDALRSIRHGDEILWDYGDQYWSTVSMKRAITGTGW